MRRRVFWQVARVNIYVEKSWKRSSISDHEVQMQILIVFGTLLA